MALTKKAFTVSPSRIVMYASCNRRWFWEYVLGLKNEEQTAAQNRGTQAHKEIENWLIYGTVPTHPAVKGAVELLPKYHEKMMVETWCNVTLPGGILNRQKADIIDLQDPENPHIIDAKTMRTLEYALSPYELAHNIQLLSYAAAVVELYAPEAKCVVLSHLQIPMGSTEHPRLITAYVTVDDLNTRWLGIQEEYVKAMQKDHEETDPKNVKPNWSHCSAYGGCPHKVRCKDVEDGVYTGEGNMTTPAEELAISVPAPSGKFDVYVDCMPDDTRDVIPLSDLLFDATKQIAQKYGDWRNVEYGGGKGLLAQALREIIKRQLPDIYISTREDIASVGMEVLIPLASKVVRAR